MFAVQSFLQSSSMPERKQLPKGKIFSRKYRVSSNIKRNLKQKSIYNSSFVTQSVIWNRTADVQEE